MCSFASDSHCVGMLSPLEGRVRPEDLQEQGPLPDLAQCRRDVGGSAMALEVHEDHVLPGPLLGRTRFDLREIDPEPCQRLEDPVERTRLIAHREEDRRLVCPVGPLGWWPTTRKRVEFWGLSSTRARRIGTP